MDAALTGNRKRKRRLFLHIGMEKTGSTSLQSFLSGNARQLEQQGFCYPTNRLKAYFQHINHAPIAGALADEKEFILLWNLSGLSRVLDDLAADLQAEPRDVILSSEHLSSRVFRTEDLERLKAVFGDREVFIVAYIRRQDEMALSAYSTRIRSGGRVDFDLETVNRENRFFNHFEALSIWAGVFGDDRMKVRVYDRHSLVGGDVRDDFLGILGISDTSGFRKGTERNRSLDASQLDRMRQINSRLPTHRERSPFTHFFIVIFLELTSRLLPRGVPLNTLLNEHSREAIMTRFDESNRKVEERFLQPGALSAWGIAKGKSVKR